MRRITVPVRDDEKASGPRRQQQDDDRQDHVAKTMSIAGKSEEEDTPSSTRSSTAHGRDGEVGLRCRKMTCCQADQAAQQGSSVYSASRTTRLRQTAVSALYGVRDSASEENAARTPRHHRATGAFRRGDAVGWFMGCSRSGKSTGRRCVTACFASAATATSASTSDAVGGRGWLPGRDRRRVVDGCGLDRDLYDASSLVVENGPNVPSSITWA